MIVGTIDPRMYDAVRGLLSLYKDIQTGVLIPDIDGPEDDEYLIYRDNCDLCVVASVITDESEGAWRGSKCYHCPWQIYEHRRHCSGYPCHSTKSYYYGYHIGDVLEPSIHRLQRWIALYERDMSYESR